MFSCTSDSSPRCLINSMQSPLKMTCVRCVITIAQDVRYITELYLNIAHLIEGIRYVTGRMLLLL